MAKFLCVCGTVIRTSGNIPNENQWQLMSDVDFDSFQGMVDVEAIYLACTVVFRCPVSDHLWIYWNGFDQPPQLYAPTPHDS